jgi:hypothetical protein
MTYNEAHFASDVKQVLERTLEPKSGVRKASTANNSGGSAARTGETSKRKKQDEPLPLPPDPPKTDIVPNPNALY